MVSAPMAVQCVIRCSFEGTIWYYINMYIVVSALIFVMCVKMDSLKRAVLQDINAYIIVSAPMPIRLNTIPCKVTVRRDELNVCVCVLLATCDRYTACDFSSLCIHVSTWGERVFAQKLTGFQLNNKFLKCIELELFLPYIILKNKTRIVRSLKSCTTEFKNNYLISEIYYFDFNYNFNNICKLLPNTLTLHISTE